MNKFQYFISLFIMSFILLENAIAQDTSNALKTLQVKPKVELSTFQTTTNLNSALTFRIKITNLTDSYIVISKIKLQMPTEFISASSEDFQKEIEKNTRIEKERGLDPGNEWLCVINIPANNSSFNSLLRKSNLTFIPGEYEVYATVGFKVLPGRETDMMESTKIRLEPNFSSIVVGGFLGSLLLTVMLGFYNYKLENTNQKIKEVLFNSAMNFLKGGISAYVILLLMFRMKDLSLPINISITDFYGGVVLGLFTYKLSDWVYKLLTEKAK